MTDDPQQIIRRLIRDRGGAAAVAAALGMDPRNMQRIYAGKRHASLTLARRIGELPVAKHG